MIALALLAASGVALSGVQNEPAALDTAFYILRNGEPIGYHAVDIEETEEGLLVSTHIEMKVKFGPILLFRYQHEAKEVWRDGALQTLTSETNDNGNKMSVTAHREEGVLLIAGDKYTGRAPKSAVPSSYWNRAHVGADKIINTQNGEVIEVTIADLGKTIAPSGRLAEQFRIVGSLTLNVWYDGDLWVGSNFIIDGEELIYLPVQTPDERQKLFAHFE